MTNSKETSVGSQHLNNVTFLKWCFSFGMMYCTAEYPRMEPPKAFLLAFAKNNLIYHLFIYHLLFYSPSPTGEGLGVRLYPSSCILIISL